MPAWHGIARQHVDEPTMHWVYWFWCPAEGGGVAKLARTRSGNVQAPGLVSNETALGALAMALLVFQGDSLQPCSSEGTVPSVHTQCQGV
jgi:hypothetical protein